MLSDKVLEEILLHGYMRNFDMESQAQIIKIFEDVMKKEREENVYATISELLGE